MLLVCFGVAGVSSAPTNRAALHTPEARRPEIPSTMLEVRSLGVCGAPNFTCVHTTSVNVPKPKAGSVLIQVRHTVRFGVPLMQPALERNADFFRRLFFGWQVNGSSVNPSDVDTVEMGGW